MSDKKQAMLRTLRDLVDVAADGIVEADSSELRDELQMTEAERAEMLSQTRAALLEGVVRHRAALRTQARRGYEQHVAELAASSPRLPESPEARRQLVMAVLSAKPDVREAVLTMQHRDFKDLDDDEVERILRQLVDLGHIDEIPT